jgi:GGDEF domain-containing protein
MFSPKKELEPTKIRLPRRNSLPEITFLSELLAAAADKRGHDVEVSWSESETSPIFSLVVRVQGKDGDLPLWVLWEANGPESRLAWRYESNDLEFINDMVYMCRVVVPSANASPESEPSASSLLKATESESNPKGGQVAAAAVPDRKPEGTPFGTLPRESEKEKSQRFIGSPADVVLRVIARAAAPSLGPVADNLWLGSESTIEGGLERLEVSTLLQALAISEVTGKLEITSDQSDGCFYFHRGVIQHATTATNIGDVAVAEMASWLQGNFRFLLNEAASLRSVNNALDVNILEGATLRDQKRRLEESGLGNDSFLKKKHQKLSDAELKVILLKGQPIDFALQAEVYRKIGRRCTLGDLLRDRPMESITLTKILFNFLAAGLIDIKPAEAAAQPALEFLGESKAAVQVIMQSMVRPETGIYSYPALLYFLQYEFYRFESYGWPMTIVLLELSQKDAKGGLDPLSARDALIATKRIEVIKRPLDILAHFETLHYALFLPNTNAASGAYVANRILQALTVTPLSPGLDKRNLRASFGIASLPSNGEDLETLITEGKNAMTQAKSGDFPIVLATGTIGR